MEVVGGASAVVTDVADELVDVRLLQQPQLAHAGEGVESLVDDKLLSVAQTLLEQRLQDARALPAHVGRHTCPGHQVEGEEVEELEEEEEKETQQLKNNSSSKLQLLSWSQSDPVPLREEGIQVFILGMDWTKQPTRIELD